MYSALKKDGQPLYKLARNGIEIERAARKVQVHSIDLLDLSAGSFILKVACSKGTYIRTLVEDLAQSLGTYAHVTGLHRTKSGNFTAEQMFTLEEIEQLAENDSNFVNLDAKLLPITSVLNSIPEVRICSSSAYYIRTGRSIIAPQAVSSGIVSLVSEVDNLFVGLGEVLKNGMVIPRRLTSFSG
jgi:tRNA pseudouridine55 synthase